MRSWVALLFWAATLPGQSPTPEDICSIEGAVVNAVTGIPVKKGAVPFLGESAGKPLSYTTVTDALGRYQAQRIESGNGNLQGVVKDRNGSGVGGATVVLLRPGGQRTPSSWTDQIGRFHMNSIPPGDYKIFAWADIEEGLCGSMRNSCKHAPTRVCR